SFTGLTTLTNASGGVVSLNGGTIGDVTTNNSGTVVAAGTSTINGAFNNLPGGVVDLTKGSTPTANQLSTGAFHGQAGSAVNVTFDFLTGNGSAGLLTANGPSGPTPVNFANVTAGTSVILGNAVTVIKDKTGGGPLSPNGATEAFGL